MSCRDIQCSTIYQISSYISQFQYRFVCNFDDTLQSVPLQSGSTVHFKFQAGLVAHFYTLKKYQNTCDRQFKDCIKMEHQSTAPFSAIRLLWFHSQVQFPSKIAMNWLKTEFTFKVWVYIFPITHNSMFGTFLWTDYLLRKSFLWRINGQPVNSIFLFFAR